MNRFVRYTATILMAGVCLYGCKFLEHIQPKATNPSNPIKRVAVLPLQNDTADIDAPNFVRTKLTEVLVSKQYNVRPSDQVDQLLRDKLGATLGGQLKDLKPQKLKDILDVEGVVMGTLMDFNETTTGVYNVRKVRGTFKLVNCMTGKTFWKGGLGIKSQDSTGDLAGTATSFAAELKDRGDQDVPWETLENETSEYGAGENFVISLGKKLFSKATNSHLEKETDEMIRRITRTLPAGPGTSSGMKPLSFTMPEFKMPAIPYLAYMDHGPKYFSAVLHTTAKHKTENQTTRSTIPVAKSGTKYRMDMDFKQLSSGADMPTGFQKMTMIHRGDRKQSYSLYPEKKRYVIFTETDESYPNPPKVKKTKIKEETVNGHPTVKYKVQVIHDNGVTHEGYIWNAKDLQHMTIKSQIQDEDVMITSILKKISLKKPSDARFSIPSGYTKAENMLELFMNNP